MTETPARQEIHRRLDQLNELWWREGIAGARLVSWFVMHHVPVSLHASSRKWILHEALYEQKEQIAHTIASIPFEHKPLVFGEAAMLYYGLRTANDLDVLVERKDFLDLSCCYPQACQMHQGVYFVRLSREQVDLNEGGLFPLRCWEMTDGLSYEQLAKDAETTATYKVIALRKLLLLKALHIEEQNNQRDVSLLAERLLVLEQIRQGCQDGQRLR